MHVIKMDGAGAGEPAVRLVDGDGQPVAEVDGFLRLLTVPDYSPNTIRAYAHDLQKLLGLGDEAGQGFIAGPLAETLRAGQLNQDALDWIKTNFYKTELELGHCLRLPQEGPCECDLYLTCAKFVTTPQYAPRLRERLSLERQLADDARQRGWDREVDRHERISDRIHGLRTELGEPCVPPEGTA